MPLPLYASIARQPDLPVGRRFPPLPDPSPIPFGDGDCRVIEELGHDRDDRKPRGEGALLSLSEILRFVLDELKDRRLRAFFDLAHPSGVACLANDAQFARSGRALPDFLAEVG